MDGPYRFDISRQMKTSWIITFIKDDLEGEKHLMEREVDLQAFTSEISAAANSVVEFCR
jgi:hypothetical protein